VRASHPTDASTRAASRDRACRIRCAGKRHAWASARLRVVGGGCAGFSYDLYFEDKVGEMDEEYESNGVQLFVDPLSNQYHESTEID